MISIAAIRKEYQLETLHEKDVEKDPLKQFDKWWQEAINSSIDEVNAFTLATATTGGKPSARIVLLKGYDKNGFIFFTNYESHKGRELAVNPNACIVFFWKELERQVRIEGKIEKLSSGESDDYFTSRPVESQLGAWSSPQSTVIEKREILDANLSRYKQEFTGNNIPRPPYWGGYRLVPELIEFWQGRPSRLHDRIQYSLQQSGNWKIERLAP